MAGTGAIILVNPAAGGGRARRAMPRVVAFLRDRGYRAVKVESQSAGDLEQRAAEAARTGYEPIVVAGGDGTVQHAVRGVLDSRVTLGIIPLGTGNDFATALGIPSDPIDAANLLLSAAPRSVDVVRARFGREGETRIYLGGGGMGLDAEAAALAAGRFRALPGAARYVAGALWALAKFRPFRLEIEMDGQPAEPSEPLLFAAVSNTPFYGGGIKIAPGARIDDGQLDITLVRKIRWTRLAELIPTVLQTGRIGAPEVERFRAQRARLAADRPVKFHGDGEVLGESPVELECLPGAIRVLSGSVGPAR